MENANQRKLGAILSYLTIIISTLVQLIYMPFMIKMLGQSEYGLYSLVSSIIGYLTVLDMGFGNAIVVYTSKYKAQGKIEEEKKMHGMFFVVFCAIGVVATLLGIILFFSVDFMFGNTMTSIELGKMRTMMLVLTFNLAISFPFSIYTSILNAYEQFTFQKLMSIANTLLKPIIMIPLLFLGCKSVTMSIVITVINLFVMLSNYYYCKLKLQIRIKYMGFDSSLFREIISYSFFIFLGVIVDKINWSIGQFVLGIVSGTIAVSIYSVATQINNLFINLATASTSVLLPKMSKMIAVNSSDEEITDEFIKVGRLQYLLIFLMASGLTLFGKEFFIAWVGIEYVESYYITLILVLPLCIPLIQNLGISIMQAKNMHRFRSILYVSIAVVNVMISIPLAKNYGGIGSAIGTAASLIIGNGLIINIYYYKRVGINVIKFWKNIIGMSIPMLIPIVIIIIFMKFISLNGFVHLIVFGGIYTFIYCIVTYMFIMNDYEKGLIFSFLKKLRR